MKKVSIIILSYKHQNFIAKALEGVFMQKVNFPVELILCDDQSPDNTDAVIKETLKKAPHNIEIKYTRHQKNMGSTPNFYWALRQVTGNYIAFCEGDDYWIDENKLQMQLDLLEQEKDYALCFHNAVNISDYERFNGTPFSHVEDRVYAPTEIYQNWIIHTATVIVRREVLTSDAFKKTLVDPTLLYFDTILFLAASTIGKLRGTTPVMSAYRRHDAGLSFGKKNFLRDLRHNNLDEIIGSYHKKEIKKIADWLIFSRSRINLRESFLKGKLGISLQNLRWILKKYKILRIYILKKLS